MVWLNWSELDQITLEVPFQWELLRATLSREKFCSCRNRTWGLSVLSILCKALEDHHHSPISERDKHNFHSIPLPVNVFSTEWPSRIAIDNKLLVFNQWWTQDSIWVIVHEIVERKWFQVQATFAVKSANDSHCWFIFFSHCFFLIYLFSLLYFLKGKLQ